MIETPIYITTVELRPVYLESVSLQDSTDSYIRDENGNYLLDESGNRITDED